MIIDSKDINRGNIANIYHVSGRALIKGKGKYQKKYNRNIITFDIETTSYIKYNDQIFQADYC